MLKVYNDMRDTKNLQQFNRIIITKNLHYWLQKSCNNNTTNNYSCQFVYKNQQKSKA